jgi:hypothetical protein
MGAPARSKVPFVIHESPLVLVLQMGHPATSRRDEMNQVEKFALALPRQPPIRNSRFSAFVPEVISHS